MNFFELIYNKKVINIVSIKIPAILIESKYAVKKPRENA